MECFSADIFKLCRPPHARLSLWCFPQEITGSSHGRALWSFLRGGNRSPTTLLLHILKRSQACQASWRHWTQDGTTDCTETWLQQPPGQHLYPSKQCTHSVLTGLRTWPNFGEKMKAFLIAFWLCRQVCSLPWLSSLPKSQHGPSNLRKDRSRCPQAGQYWASGQSQPKYLIFLCFQSDLLLWCFFYMALCNQRLFFIAILDMSLWQHLSKHDVRFCGTGFVGLIGMLSMDKFKYRSL